MRARLGRPDLARYADRFDVPEAEGAFATTFLGVSTVLVDDGETALLTDGYFSRPSMGRVLLGRLTPDEARIDAALHRAGIDRLAVVAPVHTHFDHALDSPAVVRRTGARCRPGCRPRRAVRRAPRRGPPSGRVRLAGAQEGTLPVTSHVSPGQRGPNGRPPPC